MPLRPIPKLWKGFLGSLAALSLFSLFLLSLGEHAVYFYSPKEIQGRAEELSKREIRLGGLVLPGSLKKNPEIQSLSFQISEPGSPPLQVHYKGAVPEMFREEAAVVLEGRLCPSGSSFKARRLMVKHSEEYRAPHTLPKNSDTLLKRSLFK